MTATATVRKPRTRKPATTAESATGPTASKGKKGRRKVSPTQGEVIVTDAEVVMVKKYPHQCILPGSYRTAGGREGWGNKHTVVIVCKACDKHRILATSDLQWHTTAWCVKCAADVKKNARKTATEKKGQ